MRPEAGTYVVAAVPGPGPGPISGSASASDYDEQPISRTYQYRKVMKPMLERKRRARINRCLDELKELMVGALHAEGENVSKLEKADILELTVRHLHKLRRHQSLVLTPEAAYADRFRAGFSRCAAEVSQYLAGAAGAAASTELMHHLSNCVRHLEQRAASNTPPASPETPVTKLQDADADADADADSESAAVWRPW